MLMFNKNYHVQQKCICFYYTMNVNARHTSIIYIIKCIRFLGTLYPHREYYMLIQSQFVSLEKVCL